MLTWHSLEMNFEGVTMQSFLTLSNVLRTRFFVKSSLTAVVSASISGVYFVIVALVRNEF